MVKRKTVGGRYGGPMFKKKSMIGNRFRERRRIQGRKNKTEDKAGGRNEAR